MMLYFMLDVLDFDFGERIRPKRRRGAYNDRYWPRGLLRLFLARHRKKISIAAIA